MMIALLSGLTGPFQDLYAVGEDRHGFAPGIGAGLGYDLIRGHKYETFSGDYYALDPNQA